MQANDANKTKQKQNKGQEAFIQTTIKGQNKMIGRDKRPFPEDFFEDDMKMFSAM